MQQILICLSKLKTKSYTATKTKSHAAQCNKFQYSTFFTGLSSTIADSNITHSHDVTLNLDIRWDNWSL